MRPETISATNISVGVLSVAASLAALAIYMFDFAGEPLSVVSLFWAAPMVSPLASFVFMKSKIGGATTQAALYGLALLGAYNLIEADCNRGNCETQNRLVSVFAGMVAGIHMICMVTILVLMFIGVWKMRRLQKRRMK